MTMFHVATPSATVHMGTAHIHAINVIGAGVFAGAIIAHLPTLAWYTAAVGAVWYTLLAVRLTIQSYKDVRDWFRERRSSRTHK